MKNLYANPSRFNRALCLHIPHALPMLVVVFLLYWCPWDAIYDLPCYSTYIDWIGRYFPDIDATRLAFSGEEQKYRVAFVAFEDFVGPVCLVWAATQIELADKVANGTFPYSTRKTIWLAIGALFFFLIALIGSMVGDGVSGYWGER